MLTPSNKILSEITSFYKYSKYIPGLNRRESWEELCQRNMDMHIKKFPKLSKEIEEVYQFVIDKKVLPSMRSFQFAGRPIELGPNRIYNCSYLPIDDWRAFSEIMFLLLGGTGVGYSVQYSHVAGLPEIHRSTKQKRYLINDSIEGWADAIRVLMKSYFTGSPRPEFDYGSIRAKGARLVTSGGKAPGPTPLRRCINNIQLILDDKKSGYHLKPIEVHDVICHIADAVLAGGIRRAALISLFSYDDLEMRTCKHGNWWETNPQRGRANNSANCVRHRIKEADFRDLWETTHASNAGEPGIYFTNNMQWGVNPCNEISLRAFQFCNLTTINASNVEDQDDLLQRVNAATILGTLQATYTDFHYLRPEWKSVTEKDALLGVSMTGICSGKVLKYDLREAAKTAVQTNKEFAVRLGIKPAARLNCIKPEGTASCVLGCSSGIHAWHDKHYIRRIRMNKNEALYNYLKKNLPSVVCDEIGNPNGAVLEIPQEAPRGAIYRDESTFDMLERIKKFSLEWVKPGHVRGDNTHNVSATISIKPDEWDGVGDWIWKNREAFNGLSALPYDGGTYTQAPFETITKEEFEKRSKDIKEVDLTKIKEGDDLTTHHEEVACAGGACELK